MAAKSHSHRDDSAGTSEFRRVKGADLAAGRVALRLLAASRLALALLAVLAVAGLCASAGTQAATERDVAAAKAGLKVAESDLKTAQKESGSLAGDVTKLDKQVRRLESDLKELEEDFNDVQARKKGSDLVQALKRIGSEITDTRSQLEKARAARSKAQADLQQSQARVAQCEQAVVAASGELQKAKDAFISVRTAAEKQAAIKAEVAEKARQDADRVKADQERLARAAAAEKAKQLKAQQEALQKEQEKAARLAADRAKQEEIARETQAKAEREAAAERAKQLKAQQETLQKEQEKAARLAAEREAEAKRTQMEKEAAARELAAKQAAEAERQAERKAREEAARKASLDKKIRRDVEAAQDDFGDAEAARIKAEKKTAEKAREVEALRAEDAAAQAAVAQIQSEVASSTDPKIRAAKQDALAKAQKKAASSKKDYTEGAQDLAALRADLAQKQKASADGSARLQAAKTAAAGLMAADAAADQARLAKAAAAEKERAEKARQEAVRQEQEKAAKLAAEKAKQEEAARLAAQKEVERQAKLAMERDAEAKRLQAEQEAEAKKLQERQAREAARAKAQEAEKKMEALADAEEALAKAQARQKAAQAKVTDLQQDFDAASVETQKAQGTVQQRLADVNAARDDATRLKANDALKRAQEQAAKAKGESDSQLVKLTKAREALAAAQGDLSASSARYEAAKVAASSTMVDKAAQEEMAHREAAKAAAKAAKEQQAAAAKPTASLAPPAAVPAPSGKPVLTPQYHKSEPMVSEPLPWTEKEEHELPKLAGDQDIVTPPAAKADIARPGNQLQFDLPMISGDKEIVEKLPAWKEWADHITFNPVTPDEINEFHGRLTKALQQEGYVFANVQFPTRIWAYGIFLAKVDCGPLGTITVKGNRYYSAKQVIRTLARQDGERFNYARIHADLFDLNAKPDISVDTKLKPIMQDGRRVINADVEVKDNLPIHGAFEVANTGTEQTNDWRFRTTLQHMNISKHDDILTADWITSPDLKDVNAIGGSYFLPLGDIYSLSLYGGWSNSDIKDVLPQLDVRGTGQYWGGQITKTVKDTNKYRLQLSGGWIFQHSQTQQDVLGMALAERTLDMSMPSVTLGYASKQFDSLSGRNFLSNTVTANFAGKYGSSESAEFNSEGMAFSDGNFVIDRLQLARVQRFFRGEEEPGKWSLFMKLEGQLSSDTLVAGVRKGVGGGESVRGYEESEVAGDQGVTGTFELRTPLFHNFIPGLKKSDEYLEANPDAWQRHRLQFIAFTDYGFVSMKQPRPGEQADESLWSAGLGLRLGLTKYSQMRLDYGYPLIKATEETPKGGRGHLSLQLQF